MLTYDQLTAGQRKWVIMVGVFHPEITESITFEQVHQFHSEFLLLRKQDPKYKIGLPLWLVKENRIGKGLYFFPKEGAVHEDTTSDETLTELETKYNAFLSQFGITTDLTTTDNVS